jgi:hypothetical protein
MSDTFISQLIEGATRSKPPSYPYRHAGSSFEGEKERDKNSWFNIAIVIGSKRCFISGRAVYLFICLSVIIENHIARFLKHKATGDSEVIFAVVANDKIDT